MRKRGGRAIRGARPIPRSAQVRPGSGADPGPFIYHIGRSGKPVWMDWNWDGQSRQLARNRSPVATLSVDIGSRSMNRMHRGNVQLCFSRRQCWRPLLADRIVCLGNAIIDASSTPSKFRVCAHVTGKMESEQAYVFRCQHFRLVVEVSGEQLGFEHPYL